MKTRLSLEILKMTMWVLGSGPDMLQSRESFKCLSWAGIRATKDQNLAQQQRTPKYLGSLWALN